MPEEGITVATGVFAEAHVPPVVVLVNVVVAPVQTVAVPVIMAGNGFTVTIALLEQPSKE